MLETNVTGVDNSPSNVDHHAVCGVSTPGQSPPPMTDLPMVMGDDPAATGKTSADEEVLSRGWDNSCVRCPSVNSETGPQSPQSGSRRTEVATALAGVHAVLDRIDSVADKQQVLGEVIVHLQALRCRLKLAEVNHKFIF